MNQPTLFDPPKPEPKEPDYEGLRRWLENKLYILRRADVMPWDEDTLRYVTKDFMLYSSAVPEVERDGFRAQFEEQMVRLRNKAEAA
jgi:hypothetical protein